MSELKNGCGKTQELLEPYFEGVLPEVQERMVAEHLWQCPHCSASLEQIRRMTVALEALPKAVPNEALLAAISARVAALPNPAIRRAARGWQRLGLLTAGSMLLVGVLWYVWTLVGSSVLMSAKPLFAYVGREWDLLLAWAMVKYQAGLHFLGLARDMAPSTGQTILDYLPRLALYIGVELVLIVGTALTIKFSHRHMCTERHAGTRRSS